jgi:hypothetical protein
MTTSEHDPPDPPTDTRGLSRKLKGIVGNVERVERAGELLMRFSPRQAARELARETSLGFDRAEDYVEAALALMARNEQGVSVAERRAMLLEKTRETWRLAAERKKAYVVRDSSGCTTAELVPEPDLKAMQGAIELEAKLYDVADDQSEQRAIALVLAVAKEALPPGPYVQLVEALAKAAGRDVAPSPATLPARSGDDGQ